MSESGILSDGWINISGVIFGRPRIHGDKFKLNDASTWVQPALSLEVDDAQLSRIRISVLQNLHFRSAAVHSMSLLLVERLNLDGSEQERKTFVVGVGRARDATTI